MLPKMGRKGDPMATLSTCLKTEPLKIKWPFLTERRKSITKWSRVKL